MDGYAIWLSYMILLSKSNPNYVICKNPTPATSHISYTSQDYCKFVGQLSPKIDEYA